MSKSSTRGGGGAGFRVTDSENVTLIGNIARDNSGPGYDIARVKTLTADGNEASGNGRKLLIPGTLGISISEQTLEEAKEIIKTSPELTWPERIHALTEIAELGHDVLPYLPAIVAFVCSLIR